MPIPADITELRKRFARDFSSVARQYRQRTGVAEPAGRAEEQAAETEAEAEEQAAETEAEAEGNG